LCFPADGRLTVEAVAGKCVRSVELKLSGGKNGGRTENEVPYFLFGNSGTTITYGGGFTTDTDYKVEATPDKVTSTKASVSFKLNMPVCT
jgi:hypothetical protein